MSRLPKMIIGTPIRRVCARECLASSAQRPIFAYSWRRSAALCKMPLLATDDSIITLRKSYYLGRAICEMRGNVVPACARERAGPIYLIMMLLAIMKDSGICRQRLAPRATRIILSRKVSRTYTKPRPRWRACMARAMRSHAVIAYVKSVLRRYVYRAGRANCDSRDTKERAHRVNSCGEPNSSFCQR